MKMVIKQYSRGKTASSSSSSGPNKLYMFFAAWIVLCVGTTLRLQQQKTEWLPPSEENVAAMDVPHTNRPESTKDSTEATPQEVLPVVVQQEQEKSIHTVTAAMNLTAFTKQQGVVIVTKLHGMHQIGLLKQSLCLLHYAYNKRVRYDIVVFTTEPLTEQASHEVQTMVHPANVTIALDNVGSLQEEIQLLSDVRRKKLIERCELPVENITWWSSCIEPGFRVQPGREPRRGRLAYNWQAEFRTVRIWRHPALREYHTMLWMDTDGFPTRRWEQDPIIFFLQHDLTLLMGNFDFGTARGVDIQERIQSSFGDNRTLCDLHLDQEQGHLVPTFGETCPKAAIPDAHGFFHVSDLTFYRSDIVHEWNRNLIGDCFCCRKYDDQHAITISAAYLKANKTWDMYANDIKLRVAHNNKIDGKSNQPSGGFKKYWAGHAKRDFPEAYGKCRITEGS